jgi:hypothetical protein
MTESEYGTGVIYSVHIEKNKIWFSYGDEDTGTEFFQRAYKRDNYCPSYGFGFRFLVEPAK